MGGFFGSPDSGKGYLALPPCNDKEWFADYWRIILFLFFKYIYEKYFCAF